MFILLLLCKQGNLKGYVKFRFYGDHLSDQ